MSIDFYFLFFSTNFNIFFILEILNHIKTLFYFKIQSLSEFIKIDSFIPVTNFIKFIQLTVNLKQSKTPTFLFASIKKKGWLFIKQIIQILIHFLLILSNFIKSFPEKILQKILQFSRNFSLKLIIYFSYMFSIKFRISKVNPQTRQIHNTHQGPIFLLFRVFHLNQNNRNFLS